MCGRYADFLANQDLADAFSLAATAHDTRLLPPSYNVAPMQQVRVIRAAEDAVILDVAKWGLVPSWAKDPSIGSRMINARLETVAEKPSFRTAFARRRCIVPASGYFEWQADASGKRPFYIHPADGSPLAFAGLVEAWRPGSYDDWLITCAIVTTTARGDLQQLHDRQPVMMRDDAWRIWLDPASPKDGLLDAAHADAPQLAWHEVGQAVGHVRNNSPELVEPAR
jgi:putative SOS response-associated peptidase YedK